MGYRIHREKSRYWAFLCENTLLREYLNNITDMKTSPFGEVLVFYHWTLDSCDNHLFCSKKTFCKFHSFGRSYVFLLRSYEEWVWSITMKVITALNNFMENSSICLSIWMYRNDSLNYLEIYLVTIFLIRWSIHYHPVPFRIGIGWMILPWFIYPIHTILFSANLPSEALIVSH